MPLGKGANSRESGADSASPAGVDPESSQSPDGVDDTLILWFLGLTPLERLAWAEDMANTIRVLREAPEVRED